MDATYHEHPTNGVRSSQNIRPEYNVLLHVYCRVSTARCGVHMPHSTNLIISGGNCAQDLCVILPLYTGVLLAIIGCDEETVVVVVDGDDG